ncbi:MAG: hypothetical protein WCY37_01785 [Candidatus Dojkabacteria bacterium]
MDKSIKNSISCSHSNRKERGEVEEKLERDYKGQYGEYVYYAGQVFVFRDGDIANKTLHVSERAQDHDNRPFLKFRARPVYVGDTQESLEEVIRDWREEDDWYFTEFGNIPGLVMPKETYTICKDPMGTDNQTVLISTEWIDNIQGDIFRIETEKLHDYLLRYPNFRKTLITLIEKFVELAGEDIYPDYLGPDNVAIYLEKGIPKIALIDRHIVWVGKYCSSSVKERLDSATARFKNFLQNPLDIENVKNLANQE